GEGGSHAMLNVITICTLHHKLHHDGVITTSGTAGALAVTHADGRPYGAPPLRVGLAAESPAVTRAATHVSRDDSRVDEREADATVALTGLGFKPAQARAAVARAATHVSRAATLEELIRAALAECRPPSRPS
ncbi:MAG TPA: hypothetical protein VM261_32670, partial [Kofleriaceae bacterium]|nr:hypothetical protein [Kofleriaceae bacterium]